MAPHGIPTDHGLLVSYEGALWSPSLSLSVTGHISDVEKQLPATGTQATAYADTIAVPR